MRQEILFSGEPAAGSLVGGKYRLEEMLSEGGGGVVWRAADPRGSAVALKFLKWSPTKSRRITAEKFKNEFAILKSLSHPNVSEIYDFGLDPASGLYFFTSELLLKGDLRNMIGAPIAVIEELLLQSLRALEYLRGHRLLHLDIKPQNLLLRKDGRHPILALIDFGLATFRPPDRPGGTANYMPPEMAVRRMELVELIAEYPPPDHRSDLYSLGVTFYHILTGVQPFRRAMEDGQRLDVTGTLRNHLADAPLPPPSAHNRQVPAYLDRIIVKLMARHPDDRYPSAIVVAQGIQYSSPRRHAPESTQTLLAYLPKEGRLIGRHRERASLEEAVRAIAEGKPHATPALCIAGGRGIGRTRLLLAAKPFAQQLEMDVHVVEDGELERIVGDEDLPPGQPQLILMDNLERLLSPAARDDAGDSSSRRDGTLAALAALVRRLHLQQRLGEPPLPRFLFAFALNTDQLPLRRALAELALDESLCRTIELKPFSASELAEYLAALLGEAPDDAVAQQLIRCTNGNPLFLTEHLEEMISRGRLFSLAGRPDAKTLSTIGVDFSQSPPPRSLSQSIREKLDLLPEEARRMALLVACFGRPASAEELREISRAPSAPHDLLLLVGAGLVRREEREGRFAFANPLAAKVVETADPRQSERLHDAIARSLRGKRSRRDELDLHEAYGSDPKARCGALLRLAERASDLSEPAIAASHLEELVRRLPAADLQARADALERLGDAYEKSRRFAEAEAAYKRLARLGAPGDLGVQLSIRAAERLGLMAMRRRNLVAARRHLRSALGFSRRSPSLTALRIRLENALGSVELRDGRFEEALERFERSRTAAEKKLSAAELASITNNELGEALLRAGNPTRALPILKRELARAERTRATARQAALHLLIGDALRHDQIRRPEESLAHYRRGLKLAHEGRFAELKVRLHNSLGNLNLQLGRPDVALTHYREGLGLAQQVEGETTGVELMVGMGLAAQRMGEPQGTIEYFEAALEFCRGPKGKSAGLIRRYRPTIYISLGDAYYQRRDFGRAEGYLREALALDRKQILSPDIRYSLYGTYAEIFLARGETDAARRYLPTLEAIAKAFPPARTHLQEIARRLPHPGEDTTSVG